MAKLLFKLRFVPEDEAEDIRRLLTDNRIDFYETSAGAFGISMPGLWLADESQWLEARKLIDEYQEQRHKNARQEYLKHKHAGTARTVIDIYRENPLRFIGYLVTIFLLTYLTIFLFIHFI